MISAVLQADVLGEVIPNRLFLLLNVLALAISYAVYQHVTAPKRYVDSFPWVGTKKQWFAELRGGVRYVMEARTMLATGYAKYGKKHVPFVVPQPAAQPLLALPLHTVKELATLSSDALDTENIARELIAADYVFETGPGDNLHMDIVRKQLTRKLPLLVSPVYEELMLAMRSWWPTGEQEWNSFKLYPTCTAIISRAAIRAFAGERLCRTSEFVEASYHYTEACFAAGPLIQLTPSFLRPAIAPMVKAVFKVNHHFDEAKRIALPVIHERIAAVRAGTSTGNTHRPEDVLQWMVEAIVPLAEKDPTHLEDNRLTARLLGVNMAAIHTTSITMTNILISLYTSPDRDTYLAGLREEVERVLRENDGEFTVKALASLHRTDSTIREAMRCHPLTDDGFRREVVAKGGIHLSDGLHLPFGLRVVVPAHAIHRDKDIYGPTADDFDAFRFSRPYETHPREMDDNTAPVGSKPTVMTTTSEEFFSFSHGRHACPGRFFASMEMKLVLAHMVMHYDVKIEETMPKRLFANFELPNSDQVVNIRSLARNDS